MLKIGTCVELSTIDKMEEKLKRLRDNNFDNCQLISWKMELWTDEYAAQLKELFEKYGVTISAFWSGWCTPVAWNMTEGPLTLGLVPPAYRHERVQNLCAGADFANRLGVKDVVTHMGFIPENPHDPEYWPTVIAIRSVAAYIKQNDQRLLFETGQETPMTMLRCFLDLKKLGVENVGVNLDSANLITYGRGNPVDALSVYGEYVFNTHAKDGVCGKDPYKGGYETPLGEGMVDFPALIRRLKEVGYTGPLTIEREISGEQQTKDILAAREYLQNILNEVYGG